MKRKEIIQMAKKLAKLEKIVQTSSDDKEIRRAQDEIMTLSSHIDNFEDIIAIDELVMEILEKS